MKIALVLQICHSQIVTGLFSILPTNHHSLLKNCLSWYDPSPEIQLWILLMPPTRFKPLSDLIIQTVSLCPTNLLKFLMNESVVKESLTLCMALLYRQIYKEPGFNVSFGNAVVEIYPFATLCWVTKDENM